MDYRMCRVSIRNESHIDSFPADPSKQQRGSNFGHDLSDVSECDDEWDAAVFGDRARNCDEQVRELESGCWEHHFGRTLYGAGKSWQRHCNGDEQRRLDQVGLGKRNCYCSYLKSFPAAAFSDDSFSDGVLC
jgi:hypothetical protein